MPPQGYRGHIDKKRKRGPGWRSPPGGGSVRGRAPARAKTFKPAARPPAYQAPVAPPSATPINQGLQTAANAQLTGGTGGYDINADPAVAAAQGLAAKMRTQAQASALAKRKQAAIEYGDPTGVEGIDDATSKAASENPFSVLKNLEHGYKTGTADLEEGLNKGNLFYSGYRGQQLGEAARGYQDSRYQAGTRFKGLMTDIGDNLANALMNADMYEASAIMGSDGGSYGGGDDGGGGNPNRVAYDPNTSLAGVTRGLLSGTGRIPGTPTRTTWKPPVARSLIRPPIRKANAPYRTGGV